ncbi:MAG: hypothetical protein IKG80_05580, partial [Clostridia bacterium]|nr:hypothetical protein [Clostridia bacterium]
MNKVTLMFPGFRTKAFTMSFDDGIDTDIRMASIMKKYIRSGCLRSPAPGEEGLCERPEGLSGYPGPEGQRRACRRS